MATRSKRRERTVGQTLAEYARKARRQGKKLGRSEQQIGQQIAAAARKLRAKPPRERKNSGFRLFKVKR